jgi:hypothetical protein
MYILQFHQYEDAFEHIEYSLDESYPDGNLVHEVTSDGADPLEILLSKENCDDNTY